MNKYCFVYILELFYFLLWDASAWRNPIVKTPRKYKNNMPPYCLCEICGEKKENWTVVYYDTLIGKCTDCMRD